MRLAPTSILLLLVPGCLGEANIHADAERPLLMTTYAYDGRGIRTVDGTLTVDVDPDANTGTIVAAAQDAFHKYEVTWAAFEGSEPYESGGVAADLEMWGDSGNGPPVFPRIRVHLAAFGQVESRVDGVVEKDPSNLERRIDAVLFVTRGRIRDPETLRIEDAEKLQPYDPAEPTDAYINQFGSQAVLLLYTERGELLRHFDYQDVRIRRG